jgi:hypothetical protein
MPEAHAPNIWIKDKGVEAYLERIFTIWARDCPAAYEEFLIALRAEYESLWTPSGMSKEGSMALKGIIPQDVYIVIEGKYPGFFRDPRNLYLAHRIMMGDYATRPRSRRFPNMENLDVTKATESAPGRPDHESNPQPPPAPRV